MADTEQVTISKEYYNQLLRDSRLLAALEGAGVDSWEGWMVALEMAREDEL